MSGESHGSDEEQKLLDVLIDLNESELAFNSEPEKAYRILQSALTKLRMIVQWHQASRDHPKESETKG